MFSKFREHLQTTVDNILITCGYSFGDEHVNSEIEFALSLPPNKTNTIIFIREDYNETKKEHSLPLILKRWLAESPFSDRLFIVTNVGIYNGNSIFVEVDEYNNDMWTFEGLTRLIA